MKEHDQKRTVFGVLNILKKFFTCTVFTILGIFFIYPDQDPVFFADPDPDSGKRPFRIRTKGPGSDTLQNRTTDQSIKRGTVVGGGNAAWRRMSPTRSRPSRGPR